MGRYEAARGKLDEAAAVREAAGLKPGTVGFNPITEKRINLALAQGRFADAQRTLDEYVVPALADNKHPQRYAQIRWMLTAELRSRSGAFARVAEPLANIRAAISASGHPELFEGQLARADFFEGLAKLGDGDAKSARPLLEHVLAVREKSQLAISPGISEVQISLAECHLALGNVALARELAAKAQAIHAQHKELGEHYREPLRRLLQHLAPASRAPKAA